MVNRKVFGVATFVLAASLGTASAQTQTPDPAGPATTSPDGSAAYATGKPLEMQSKEGFWGHVNPFARKKWVARQVDPIRDRANELDELQAKNANDIRDVDARATAGVGRAMNAAAAADAHAGTAADKADRANSAAVAADGHTTALSGTVSNLDQYQAVSTTALPFVAGHTVLGTKAKAELDTVAESLAAEKGYIVEVQGYSRSGTQTSTAMADAVVRYLVTAHQVPVYRIYRTGLGNAKQVAQDGTKPLPNGVRVTVLHNSLATMNAAAPSGN